MLFNIIPARSLTSHYWAFVGAGYDFVMTSSKETIAVHSWANGQKVRKERVFYSSLPFPTPLDTLSVCITPELWGFVEPDTSLAIGCIASMESNTVILELLISAIWFQLTLQEKFVFLTWNWSPSRTPQQTWTHSAQCLVKASRMAKTWNFEKCNNKTFLYK